MNKSRYKIRKLVIIAAGQLIMMTGCGGIKTGNDISEVYTQSEENSAIEEKIEETNEETIEETFEMETEDLELSNDNEVEETGTETIIIDKENLSECDLSDEDFEIEYQGYVINERTSPEDIENNLGYPEDFEQNNNGYTSTVGSTFRWEVGYPTQSEPDDIGIIFRKNFETDEIYLETIPLYSVKTPRGVKSGDNVSLVYELYGQPTKEQRYEANDEYLELRYIKDTYAISFVIDEDTQTIFYIYISYNIEPVIE